MSDRGRYGDDEVREVFERAAAESDRAGASPAPLVRTDGLTLAELQAVGQEAGLSPESIARAAAAVDAGIGAPEHRRKFGAPVEVRRTVLLPRAPTGREWEILVAELREAASRPGRLTSQGETREWASEGFHVFVEPSAAGPRLRLIAEREGDIAAIGFGSAALVFGLVVLLTSALDAATFGPFLESFLPAVVALLGVGGLAARTVRLRRWAEASERRIEGIAARAQELLAAAPPGDDGDGTR